jgi:hypothetical protein
MMNRALIFVLGMLTGVAGTLGYQHQRPSPQRTASPRNRQATVARCFLEHNPQGYDPRSQFGEGILEMCEAANP